MRKNKINNLLIIFLSVCICVNLCPILLSVSSADDFTAKSLGDYGNVTVMEATGNYDANNPDGSINAVPRQEIAKEFFRTHKDEYDFLVIYTNFDYQMPEAEARAFYLGVKNDTQGIGLPASDNSALFGSNGKLQGIVDMGNIANIATDPLDPKFENTLSTLSHELLHRWAAHVRFKDANENISTALLGKNGDHWSFLLNSYGSVLYGNQWQDNGNGTFTSVGAEKYYSPLDLYLMGFYDRSQVPPMLLIDNVNIDPEKLPDVGSTISGTPRYVTIDDIIAAEGERVPDASTSQKTFKSAFILITTPGAFTGYEIYGIENIRNGWVTRFSILTDGKGLMQVASSLRENIPLNPGVIPPSVTPRVLPPNIDDGVAWLMNHQGVDGSWTDLSETTERDTAEAVCALKNFAIAQANYLNGIQWLNGTYSGNADYLSRKIQALSLAGNDVSSLLTELISMQNPDGGWGSDMIYMSSSSDTSLALKALSSAGYSDQSVISKAIEYLKSKQNADGGWGSDDEGSNIQSTAKVLSAFNKYRDIYQLDDRINSGISWLLSRQNIDGGFGNSPSTVYDSALAILALRELDISTDITNNALNYILNLQSEDGSWYESPYQTALAVNAVWKATIDPDLLIKTNDIAFIPSTVSGLPANVVINAKIWNSGRTDVPLAKVTLYDGAISEANKIGEQSIAFPGQSFVIITFLVTIQDGNEHRFYISVDPYDIVKESNEVNNTALNILEPEATYDFEMLSDITVSQNPVDIFRDVKITSKITNKGTMNAYNVQVKYYFDDGTGFEMGTDTVNIPANSTITSEITWRANRAGDNLPIAIQADPFNNFTEISEENNKAVTYLTVNGATGPNLTVSYKDIVITPSPVNERANVNISALVKNEGFSSASNIIVHFSKGVPGVDGVLIGGRTIQSLNAGESQQVSIDWINIMDSGERIIYVQVDPDNQIQEISEDDNEAFTTLKILSLPDLTISTNSIVFTPPAPKDGDVVSIDVTVQNKGEQEASNVSVRAYEGSTIIGAQVIPSILGNSQASASFAYDTTGKSGAHEIKIIIDPDNNIPEQSEDNNQASRTIGIQNSDLWLTEQYISPNGDGIKDSAQFFFRLSAPQTVKVVVVNKKSKIVRTFGGSEFENISNGNITWDGLDDNGMVVADGQYQIKIVNADNAVLGSLLVIVDNNRSPLTDAIGTKYITEKNLTCALPGRWHLKWFPDDSGVVFNIYNMNFAFPEYPSGLYTMSSDGTDIRRIVQLDHTIGSSNYIYFYDMFEISPSGEKIAFTTLECENSSCPDDQLWVVDRDGNNLTLLESVNSYPYKIVDVTWSPDGKYILYKYRDDWWGEPDVGEELYIININTKEKIKIDTGEYIGDFIPSIEWSSDTWAADSSQIAYNLFSFDYDDVRVSDTLGNKKSIFSTVRGLSQWSSWFGSNKIALSYDSDYSGTKIRVTDTITGNNIEFSGDVFDIAPNKQFIAFTSTDNDSINLNISDNSGNTYVIYTYKADSYNYVWDIVISPDSNKVAFTITSSIGEKMIVIDIRNKKETVFANPFTDLYSYLPMKWLLDNISILVIEGDYDYSIFNSESGEKTKFLTYKPPFGEDFGPISPMGNYIIYNQPIDPSSGCYNGTYDTPSYPYWTWKDRDLWSLSSLLNLTADLRAIKNSSAVTLKGTASDLNFESYKLEYSDVKSPDTWNLVSPPSNVPVIDNVFTMWIPPYEGTFYVRLTVWDKAGNTAMSGKRVSWGLSSSITNIYKNNEVFSPNGDGIKDAVELHYRALEPVHLEFNIYDEKGNPVRTLLKDNTEPANDYITWDGRDGSGNVVPDGKYKIKVSDYELFVEADNTPPDVNISLTELKQDDDQETNIGSRMIYTELDGHAVDNKLKEWIVEYGEGDNPQEWHELIRGSDILAAKDDNGNPLLNPIEDTMIKKFEESGIEQLVGKKIRITAEDFAGNRSTVIADFLEEKIFLHTHQWKDQYEVFLLSGSGIYPGLSIPVVHTLGVLETMRLPILSMNVQYEILYNGQLIWIDDVSVTNPLSGVIDLTWDRSLIQQEISAVRIKAVDALGQEHYSNEVLTSSLFYIDLCNNRAGNYLPETLKLLKFQVYSSEDINYSQWTDYKVFDTSKGDIIPIGIFGLPPFPILLQDRKYQFRMIGIAADGKQYESSNAEYPPPVCNEDQMPFVVSLDINYDEADCGQLSGSAAALLKISGLSGNTSLKTLSYYIQESGGLKLLRQYDLTRERVGSAVIDTSIMSEGSYPVKAVLTYLNSDDIAIKEITVSNTLIVDRVLPTAQITYPTNSSMLCPVRVTNPKGDWYGIPLEGIATDNANVERYELYYGIGKNPSEWLPAMTKNSEGKIEPIIVKKSVQGQIGIWDVTNLRGTTFSLKLKVIDAVGNVSCYTTTFSVDTLTEIINLAADKSLFSPNNDGVLDDVNISFEIDEYAAVDVKVFKLIKDNNGRYIPDTTSVRTIVSGFQHLTGTDTETWDGKDDSGAVVPDGLYSITIFATDSCGNTSLKNIEVEVLNNADTTSPYVMLFSPQDGEYFGFTKNIINISGKIVEGNLEIYSLRYGAGDEPSQWMELKGGNAVPLDSHLYDWDVGQGKGVPDGLYTISLYARDKGGLEGEARVKIFVDNTPPVLEITFPAEGNYVKANVDIRGTAFDPNMDKYTIEFSEGNCATAFKWALIKTSASSIDNGTLASWQTIPPDGDYCLRLSAIDKLGNAAETKVNIKIDTQPPAAPVLTGKSENKTNALLNWTQNIEPDLAGYNLYRNGGKVNPNLINVNNYIDQNLSEGVYPYTVKAVDFAGWESTASNEVKIKIDLTGPDARISSPRNGSYISGLADIKGTAYSSDDFRQYRVYTGLGANPSSWSLIRTSPVPMSYGTLAQWDTITLSEGQYSIKLEAEDISGNVNSHQISVTVDNMPPAAPVLISATANGSDVTLTWQANTEPDLAGYLLFRNDQLANVSGIVIGDLKPYLIIGTTYLDRTLPDGSFKYHLIAMDQAGNESDESNSLEVEIDTHPPQAFIVEPEDGSKFEAKTLVKAESPDMDIASVQFQYKRAEDNIWINLGGPAAAQPYIAYIDPAGSGLVYGDYHLRAVATDRGGMIDPSPLFITVTYTDLTAPAAPVELEALTNDNDVSLTWEQNTEADIDGYNIYRTSGGTKTKLNTSLIHETIYQDNDLSDGVYIYEVTAVDVSGNESKPSTGASARIYAPVTIQPYTPTGQIMIQIEGNEVASNAFVEITVSGDGGYEFRITTMSNASGEFSAQVTLALGENRITAKAADNAGNISRTSDIVIVVYNEPPAAPAGFMSSVQDYDVSLTWNPNTESDLSGYNLYRDGQKLNAPLTVDSGSITSASGYYSRFNAFDSDLNTYWMSDFTNGIFTPVWWELDFASPELINHIEIHWVSESKAGKDYEIQVWSGYAWIMQTKVSGNNSRDNVFDFKPSYRTDRIRIYITDTTDINDSKQVGISEVNLLKDNLITQTSYFDGSLNNGTYNYKLTAVDYYGFESQPSDEISATVSVADTVPPPAPEIFFPTIPGISKILYNDTTDISGSAEPASSVELFKNGVSQGMTTASAEDAVKSYSFEDVVYEASLSPDGKTIAYSIYGYLMLKDLLAGEQSVITWQGGEQSWSPDGKKIAYIYPNGYSYHAAIYDVETKSIVVLDEDNGIDEHYPSWSGDGNKIAFARYDQNTNAESIWVKDLTSGNFAPLVSDISVYNLRLSPDGSRLAYFDQNVLYVKNLSSGDAFEIDAQTNGWDAEWSPDSKKLIFLSYRNVAPEIYMLDVESLNQTMIVPLPYDGFNPAWSPDGKNIALVKWEADGSESILIVDMATLLTRAVKDELNSVYNLEWVKSNDIAYLDGSKEYIIMPKGTFRFKDILLDAGENAFYASASDASGHVSPASEEISVIYDTSMMPDLEVTPDDIFIYPPYPVEGETVAIDVFVQNKGVETKDVGVDIYLWSVSGNITLIKSEKIGNMSPDSEEVITAEIDTTGKTGRNTILAVVDPEDKINELSEINNFASKEFIVSKTEGVTMTASLDSDQYRSNQNVNINIDIINSGAAQDDILQIWIEDENGYPVALLDTISLHLPYASEENYKRLWNTGSTYAGNYRVRAILKNAVDVLAENIKPFTILPDIEIDLSAATDKTHYGPNEDVLVNTRVKNSGNNYIIPEIDLKIRIKDSTGEEMFAEDRKVTDLLPNAAFDSSSKWNTGLNIPGDYSATVDIYLKGQIVANKSISFKIDASAIITGTISVTPTVIILGNTAQVEYVLQNSGNIDVNGLTAKILVIDNETQGLVSAYEETINLVMNSAKKGQVQFCTQGYSLKNYSVILRSIYQGHEKNIAAASFAVKDGTPPVISVLSPAQGSIIRDSVSIAALVSDNASGLDRVEYQLDGGLWKLLPVSDLSVGRYSTIWTPANSDEGSHVMSLRAADKTGNMADVVSVSFVVERNSAPSANARGPYAGIEGQALMLDGSGSTDDGAIIKYEWDVNNDGMYEYISSSPMQDHIYVQQGTYTIRLRVTDNPGATGEATTTAIISDTAPTADFAADLTTGPAPLAVTFTNASTGYDQPLSYEWDFNDDGIVDSTEQNPSANYTASGAYSVKLTVTDSDGSANSLTMTNYITVFDTCTNLPVRIVGKGYYSTLQAAYDAASDGDIIQSQALLLTEDLNINSNITVTLDGGYNCDYSAITGKTLLNGKITISNGTAVIGNFELK